MLATTLRSHTNIIAAIILGIAGAHVSAIMPAIVDTLSSNGNMLKSDAGFIASIELFGMGVALVSLSPFVSSISLSRLAKTSAFLFLFLNISSIQVESYALLPVLRFLGGINAGLLFGVMSTILCKARSPEKLFGTFFACHICTSFLAFQIWDKLGHMPGIQGPYIWLTAISLAAAIASFFIAQEGSTESRTQVHKSSVSIPLCVSALLAMFLYNAGVMGTWSYVIGIGNEKGINTEYILVFISFGSLAGFAGALASTWIGSRIGNTVPIGVAGGCFLLTMALLLLSDTEIVFGLSLLLFMVFWVFINPFILGTFSRLDSAGRLVTFSVASLYGGLSAGPAIMAIVIDRSNSGLKHVIYLSMTLLFISLAMLVHASFTNERTGSKPEEGV